MTDDLKHVIEAPLSQSVIVRAGPGAGKTYLIAQRLAHLLKGTMPPNSQVACITYTNTGVEEVETRLVPAHFASMPSNLYVGTIHSFLIDFVLMPYGHFLKGMKRDFRITAPSGFASKFYKYWRGETKLPSFKMRLFESIGYKLDGSLVCYQETKVRGSDKVWRPSVQKMQQFKQNMYKEGYIDLNDVLYFSACILASFPFVADCLAARFAGIVVDEFQDTTLWQNEILKMFLDRGKTSLFLVADPDQSIFSFSGATPNTLKEHEADTRFVCPACGEVVHYMSGNRRSSSRILSLLNARSTLDGGQHSLAGWADYTEPVRLLIGDRLKIIAEFERLRQQVELNSDDDKSFCVLAFQNKTVANLKAIQTGKGCDAKSTLEKLKSQNPRLRNILYHLLLAIRHKEIGEWILAYEATDRALTQLVFEESSPLFCSYDDPVVGLSRELWQVVVWMVMQQLEIVDNQTLLDWAKSQKSLIDRVVVLVGGNSIKQKRLGVLDCRSKKARALAEKCSAVDELQMVTRPNLVGDDFRTIHTAKGTERDAVLAFAETEDELDAWLCADDISENEGARRGYVAFSRARKLLCIGSETISSKANAAATTMGVEVVVLDEQHQTELG